MAEKLGDEQRVSPPTDQLPEAAPGPPRAPPTPGLASPAAPPPRACRRSPSAALTRRVPRRAALPRVHRASDDVQLLVVAQDQAPRGRPVVELDATRLDHAGHA